jgi:hypothetical protein
VESIRKGQHTRDSGALGNCHNLFSLMNGQQLAAIYEEIISQVYHVVLKSDRSCKSTFEGERAWHCPGTQA